MTNDQSDRSGGEDLEDRLRSILAEHPVRLAVLFGSTVRDERHPGSDLDLVVEFDPADSGTLDTRLSLFADLSEGLDRNDIDIAVVADLDPRVGRRAFREGELLVGSKERFAEYRRRFERDAAEEDRASPAERFDEAIERLDRVIGG